jgi:hypothetical protein
MTFRVNQKVVCIKRNGWFPRLSFEVHPSFNNVYTVREIIVLGDLVGLRLAEIRNQTHQYSDGISEAIFDASGFRPVVEPKAEISFTHGADPSSDRFDNRRVKVGALT